MGVMVSRCKQNPGEREPPGGSRFPPLQGQSASFRREHPPAL